MSAEAKLIQRVMIIGIDGAGNWISTGETPCIDALLGEGAVAQHAQSVIPTVSAQCWGSMFHGVSPEVHGLTNSQAASEPFPEDVPFPTFMKLIRQQKPSCQMASFSSWAPINHGIIEPSCGALLSSKPDAELVPDIVEYIRNVPFTCLFIHLDDVDHAGHAHGYGTKEYCAQLPITDAHLGSIVSAAAEAGRLDDCLTIVLSDHGGGGENPTSHGSSHPQDTTIFWGCCGPGVQSTTLNEVSIQDTAAVVAEALGMAAPESWEGRVPPGLWAGSR